MAGSKHAGLGIRQAKHASAGPRQGKHVSSRVKRSSSWVLRVTLSYLALPLTSLATGPLLARTLGPALRGELAAMLVPLALMPALLSFGLDNATNVLVARGDLAARRAVRLASLPAIAAGTIAVAILYPAAGYLLHSYPHAVTVLRIGSISLISELWFNVVRGAAVGRGMFQLANTERWVSALSRFVLLLALAVTGVLTLLEAFWVTVGTGALSSTVLLLALRRTAATPATEPAGSRELLSYGMRSWVGGLAGLLNARLDQSVLLPFVGAVALGKYAVAVTLAMASTYLAGAVRDVLMTRAVDADGARVAARATRLLVILVGGVSIAGALTAPWTIPGLFGSSFRGAVPLAQVLFIGSVPAAMNAALSAGLMARDRPWRVSVSELTALAVTVVGLACLVGPFGVMGAAITSVIAYSTCTVMLVRFFNRDLGISPRECVVPGADDVRWLLREVARFRRFLPRATRTAPAPLNS